MPTGIARQCFYQLPRTLQDGLCSLVSRLSVESNPRLRASIAFKIDTLYLSNESGDLQRSFRSTSTAVAISMFINAAAVASEDTMSPGGTDKERAATLEANSALRPELLRTERSGRSPHCCCGRSVGLGMLPRLIKARSGTWSLLIVK